MRSSAVAKRGERRRIALTAFLIILTLAVDGGDVRSASGSGMN
jgi:hypothetical protein